MLTSPPNTTHQLIRMRSFNDLSDAFWLQVLRNVARSQNGLNHLFKCAYIDRRFRRLINIEIENIIRPEGLHLNCLQNIVPACYNLLYTFTNHVISDDCSVSVPNTESTIRMFRKTLINRCMSNLKRISLTLVQLKNDDQLVEFESFINNLRELKQIQIRLLRVEKSHNLMNLYKIEILSVLEYRGQVFRLNAPHLNSLCWYSAFDILELSDTTRIDRLAIKSLSEGVRKFSNVKQILFYDKCCEEPIQLINAFANLNEIRFRSTTKANLLNLFKQRKLSGRMDLRIVIRDFTLNESDVDTFYQTAFDRHNRICTKYIITNFQKLAHDSRYLRFFDYSSFVRHRHLLSSLDLALLQKVLVGVSTLKVDQRIDSLENLSKFLGELRSIKVLQIFRVKVNQKFFNDLHLSCPYLISLELCLLPVDAAIKLSFISKLDYLAILVINKEITFPTFKYVLKKSTSLNRFVFRLSDKILKVNFSSLTIDIQDYLDCQKNTLDLSHVKGTLTENFFNNAIIKRRFILGLKNLFELVQLSGARSTVGFI